MKWQSEWKFYGYGWFATAATAAVALVCSLFCYFVLLVDSWKIIFNWITFNWFWSNDYDQSIVVVFVCCGFVMCYSVMASKCWTIAYKIDYTMNGNIIPNLFSAQFYPHLNCTANTHTKEKNSRQESERAEERKRRQSNTIQSIIDMAS